MANQMIALQARNPQIADPARVTAQMANMMNTARQAEAAQRQAQQAEQAMAFAAAKEGRERDLHDPALKKAELEYVAAAAAQFSQDVGKLADGDVAGAEAVRADIVAKIPAYDRFIRPASEWTPEYKAQLMLKGKEIADKIYPDVTASKEYAAAGARDAQGNIIPEGTVIETRIGGFPGAAGSTPLRATGAATPTPRATPTAPQAAEPANPFAPGYEPNTAAANPNSLGLVIDSALETGVMSKSDYDKLLSIAPPESRAKIAAWVQQNNVQIMSDMPGVTDNQMRGEPAADFQTTPMAYDGQTPQSQFAVMRGEPMQSQTAGLRGAPPMEQTLAQYIPVQRRDPNVAPLPGSSQVPIERVRQEAAAGRETANEVYAKELARARAARDAAKEAGPKPLTPVQEAKLRDNIAKDYKSARSTISMMLDPVSGVVASVNKVRKLSPAQKEAITGYSGYLPSITPGSRSADTAIKNLRGKVTEMGKSAAALTGAIGQMAVQEWRIVSDMIASLDIEGMEPADLDNQLDIIEAQARRAAEVTRDAYENQYVEEFARYPGRFQLPTSSSAPVKRQTAEPRLPRVRNDADYNKLKPGTIFIDPNGVRRRKP